MDASTTTNSSSWRLVEQNDPSEDFLTEYFQLIQIEGSEETKFKKVAKKINDFAYSVGNLEKRKDIDEFLLDIRRNFLNSLKSIALDVVDDIKSEDVLLIQLGRAHGTYAAEVAYFTRKPGARLSPPQNPDKLRLEPLDKDSTDAQRALFIDIERTYSVVDIVLRRRVKENKSFAQANEGWKRKRRNIQELRSTYLLQLKDIADEGFSAAAATSYANQKLALFREAFVSREADYVKNEHVQQLGYRAIFLVFILSILYFFINNFASPDYIDAQTSKQITNFIFLSIGACTGTWLSFSLRRVIIGFEDLILLEPDRLNPTGRLIFVVILTCMIGLMLNLNWISISIAGEPLKPNAQDAGQTAFLLGAMCGIAERTIAGVVSSSAQGVFESGKESIHAKGE